jgi:hypothetical protein
MAGLLREGYVYKGTVKGEQPKQDQQPVHSLFHRAFPF